MTTRRRFLTASAVSALFTTPAMRLFAQSSNAATLSLAASDGPRMPKDFVGLSYEIQQLTEPEFFSSANTGLIAEFRGLTPNGVLRLGGNTSEFAWWKPTPDSPEPVHPKTREVVGEPPAKFYPVTAKAVENLAGFLKATGWTCLYGINLANNTPERAVDEAAFVTKTLGSSLQYFQLGNEADLYSRHLRDPKTWNFQAYFKEWLTLARAIVAKVPDAKFGMPDVASDLTWLTDFADTASTVEHLPHVTTLSHHFYFEGPATNPKVNIHALLTDTSKIQKIASVATAASARVAGTRVRMTEGNTCYGGGKPGVSDVFASALWSADYALYLASMGYSGINLHGGTGESVANSVGGVLPGDVLLKTAGKTPAEIATHPHPFYTPIGTFDDKYVLQPVGVGLKFAGLLSGSSILPVHFSPGRVNTTAYAAKQPTGQLSFIVLNKDEEMDLNLTIEAGQEGTVRVDTLTAPALDAREASITRSEQKLRTQKGSFHIKVPKSSGMLLTVA